MNNDEVQQCLAFNLRRATRLVSQYYDAALRPLGLRITQFNLLAALDITGPITVTELADAFAIDRTTLTRNLKVLEQAGDLKLATGSDRRTRVVSMAPAGKARLAAVYPAWQSAHAELVERLGDDFSTTLDVLRQLEDVVNPDG